MFMKHIVLSSVLFVTSIIIPNWYLNAWYLDWDCNNRDTIPEMNAFIEEKTTSMNEVRLARKNYKQTEIDSLMWELEKILAHYDSSLSISGDDADKILFFISRTATNSLSGSNLERANQLISEINMKVANQPKWSFDVISYNTRISLRDACVKKFADIDKKNELTAEQKAKEDEVRKTQEIERTKINATAQKEQEEAEIRALTKKKLEIELEALSKGKWENTSSGALKLAPTLEQNKTVINNNMPKAFEEYDLLKTSREKNSFIGKRTVALKRELRKADKARVKEIINEMRDLKKLQK